MEVAAQGQTTGIAKDLATSTSIADAHEKCTTYLFLFYCSKCCFLAPIQCHESQGLFNVSISILCEFYLITVRHNISSIMFSQYYFCSIKHVNVEHLKKTKQQLFGLFKGTSIIYYN